MKNLRITIGKLEDSVSSLIDKNKFLNDENRKLRDHLAAMQEDVRQKNEEINSLANKNKILRIAGGSNGGDKREIKLKINELVREVDKCIAQLNK